MNYELAKELKDAGYPQERGEGSYRHRENREPSEMGCYAPTLSELIEACGEDFLGVHRVDRRSWYADTHTHSCECGKPKCGGYNWEHETGSTLEEAVARLWLALNKRV